MMLMGVVLLEIASGRHYCMAKGNSWILIPVDIQFRLITFNAYTFCFDADLVPRTLPLTHFIREDPNVPRAGL
jgi:hypothetical protein